MAKPTTLLAVFASRAERGYAKCRGFPAVMGSASALTARRVYRLVLCFLEPPADESGRRCPTGEVRVTSAGNLPAHWVIHAVGPFYNERYADKARQQLRQVYQKALEAAAAQECRSVALPAISTGAYRFPLADAARIALEVAEEQLQRQQSVELVRFVLFKPAHWEVFRAALQALSEECGNSAQDTDTRPL